MDHSDSHGDLEKFTTVIPDDVAIYVGHITNRWTLIEEMLGSIIRLLLRHDDRVGHAVTAELGSIQRISLIGALIDCSNHYETLSLWRAATNIIDDVRNMRNDVVHGVWVVGGKYHCVLRSKAKGKQTDEALFWQPEILKKLLNMHEDCFELLRDFKGILIENDIPNRLKNPPDAPDQRNIQPPSFASQLQAQARAQKKARKEADRARSRAQAKPEAP